MIDNTLFLDRDWGILLSFVIKVDLQVNHHLYDVYILTIRFTFRYKQIAIQN